MLRITDNRRMQHLARKFGGQLLLQEATADGFRLLGTLLEALAQRLPAPPAALPGPPASAKAAI